MKFAPRVVDSSCLWQSVLAMVESGEGVSLVPLCLGHLRSNGVIFKPLSNRGCQVEVVLACGDNGSDAIRKGSLDLLRKITLKWYGSCNRNRSPVWRSNTCIHSVPRPKN
jgi:hypothetical protein